MNLKIKMNKGWFYRNELWFSKAYHKLPIAARNLLQCLVTEINKVQNTRTKKWKEQRNGEVSFTESQFRKLTGYTKVTFNTSKNILVERGLIKITHLGGGGGSGDRSMYEVLICDDVPKEKQRWRRYPKENWKHEVPKRKNNLIGKKTQWKKGQSGKKIKSTL